jgi:RNA polymerase sigma factor (sigma-70 family)
MPNARAIARSVVRRLPRHVEVHDLIAAAYCGLVDAAERFDPDRGLKFITLAEIRMRGAIYDEIRARNMIRGGRRGLMLVPLEDLELEDPCAAPAVEFARLADLVRQLTPNQRRVIVGLFWDELSGKQLSQRIGTSQGRVWQLRRAALDALRRRLES